MYATKNETKSQTLTRLIRAMDHQHPVTITYTKAGGTETLRTIEIYDVTTTKAGDIVIKAMDRDSQEQRSFRLDRIQTYTIHRTAYTVPRPAVDAPSGHGLRAATVILAPHPLAPVVTTEQRVNVLAGFLAAA
jgi:predicted DNA-binding transcriptional regulator YafY